MVIVIAEVDVVPRLLDEAFALSRAHVARSRAEPGCLSHAVLVDPDRPTHLVFVEEWATEAALQDHFAVPATQQFVDALAVLAAARPSVRLYRAQAMPLPGPRAA